MELDTPVWAKDYLKSGVSVVFESKVYVLQRIADKFRVDYLPFFEAAEAFLPKRGTSEVRKAAAESVVLIKEFSSVVEKIANNVAKEEDLNRASYIVSAVDQNIRAVAEIVSKMKDSSKALKNIKAYSGVDVKELQEVSAAAKTEFMRPVAPSGSFKAVRAILSQTAEDLTSSVLNSAGPMGALANSFRKMVTATLKERREKMVLSSNL